MRLDPFRAFRVSMTLILVLSAGFLPVSGRGDMLGQTRACADEGKKESGRSEGKKHDKALKRDEVTRRMDRLEAERDRRLRQIEEEYNREADQAEEEYWRDISREDDGTKAQAKLQRKLDDLDRRFQEKQRRISEWYGEKKQKIYRGKSDKD